ncbi:MAG: response regulator [Terriglobales bacterium]
MSIRVVLVEDHTLVRQGFRRLLEDNPRLEVVGEGRSGVEAVELAEALRPDVMLLDMAMPELNGLEAATQILRRQPQSKLIILSMYSDEAYVRQALRLGVKGYLLKDAVDLDLPATVEAVAGGETCLSPAVAVIMASAFRDGTLAAPDDPFERLTPREKQVLQLVAQGKSNKEIAHLLKISPNTVAVHRANLMDALGIHGTAELVLFAVKKGFVKT